MIRVGIAGVGFMGWMHYLAYERVRGIGVSAICTRNRKKLAGDWRSIKGNFGPAGEQVDVSGMGRYREIDDLLADDTIDLIDICLPPDCHADVAARALRAGKHVFCEKPLALTVRECKQLVTIAEKAQRQLLVGHVLPFFPEYAYALKVIQSGKYGALLGGHFKRVISDPLWLKDFYDPAKVGGPLLDLHVHDAHFIRLLCGMPHSVISQGRHRGDVVEFCTTIFRFADPDLCISASSGVINEQGRSFTHGYEIHLEKATLQFELAVCGDGVESMPLKVLTHNGRVQRPKLPAGDDVAGFQAEVQAVAKSIKSGVLSPVLSGELARDAIVLCHKQAESARKGRPVKV